MTKPRAISIRFRLTAWYTVILAITLAVMGVGVWLALNHSIESNGRPRVALETG